VALGQQQNDDERPAEPWSGEIDEVSAEAGSITIYGREFTLDSENLEVIMDGVEVDAELLEPGLIIRFAGRRGGQQSGITRIRIVGPEERIRQFNQH
jgi:hypothetical protein